MLVKILIEFDVDTDDENVAKAAASVAAWDFLTFCTVSGHNSDTEEVEVQVDGEAEKISVRLGITHD